MKLRELAFGGGGSKEKAVRAGGWGGRALQGGAQGSEGSESEQLSMQVTGHGATGGGDGVPEAPDLGVSWHPDTHTHTSTTGSLLIVPRGPGKHTHTHRALRSKQSQSKDRHPKKQKCIEAERDHTQSDTHPVRYKDTHTQGHLCKARDSKTPNEHGCSQAHTHTHIQKY